MAAENLTKLSKDDMKSCALTGKRTDTKSWVFVYEQALADVCGDCVHNLFKPAHTGVDLTFSFETPSGTPVTVQAFHFSILDAVPRR